MSELDQVDRWWNDIVVIDGDGHLASTEEVWENYLEAPYKERRPRIVEDNRGSKRWLVEGQLWPKPEGISSGQPEGIKGSMLHEGAVNAKRRLQDMDLEGIDIGVMFGNLPEIIVSAFRDKDYASGLARAWNNYLVDFCKAAPERLHGVAVIPMQDVPAAVAELRRAIRELKLPAVMLPTNVGGKDLDHSDFLPVWDEIARLNVPVTIHGAPSALSFAGDNRFENYFYTHCVAHPFEQMISMMTVVCGGILERHPHIKVAFLESGVGWMPYWIHRLDEHFEKRANLVPITKLPSEQIKSGNVYFFCEPDEDSMAEFVREMPNRVVFTSDYPHWDATFPGAVAKLATRKDISREICSKILSDNPGRFYGFDTTRRLKKNIVPARPKESIRA